MPTTESPAPSRLKRRRKPSGYALTPEQLIVLVCCAVLLLFAAILILTGPGQKDPGPTVSPAPTVTVRPTPAPTPTSTPEPTPTPTPEPTPTPLPLADLTQPVPESDAADPETWFADAAFIGDSRTEGFRLYSGVRGGTFFTHTGLTVYQIQLDHEVIRVGEDRVTVMEALKDGDYGKIYLSMGVNELGYYNPSDYARVYGIILDDIREMYPDAVLYVQAILPVNSAKCKSYGQAAYVNNEAIAQYNEALAAKCAEAGVWFLDVPPGLLDEDGEILKDLSSDGVHLKKQGYQLWLDWLLTHTGAGYRLSE